MSVRKQKVVGTWGETYACNYLQIAGYKLLGRNYHSRYGEIDLIMYKDQTLVFVEVKTRTNNSFGPAEGSITNHKLKALQDTIAVYLEENDAGSYPWQLDLIIIEKFDKSDQINLLHYENLGELSA